VAAYELGTRPVVNTYRFLWGGKNPGKPFEAANDLAAIDLILPTPPVRGKTYDQIAEDMEIRKGGKWVPIRPKK
jgi:hypothetical protein